MSSVINNFGVDTHTHTHILMREQKQFQETRCMTGLKVFKYHIAGNVGGHYIWWYSQKLPF